MTSTDTMFHDLSVQCIIARNSEPWEALHRVNGLHAFKRLVWRILVVIMRLFKSKNRKNYSTSNNETTFKSNLLPQRKNSGCELRISTTLIPLGIDWTIISIHFPINKSRAHGSVSSRFAGDYGSEFLAMSIWVIKMLTHSLVVNYWDLPALFYERWIWNFQYCTFDNEALRHYDYTVDRCNIIANVWWYW